MTEATTVTHNHVQQEKVLSEKDKSEQQKLEAFLKSRLPPLRDDLSIYPGPLSPEGQKTWVLYDPVRNQYFRLGELEFQFLSRWDQPQVKEVLSGIESDTLLYADPMILQQFVGFLQNQQLLQVMDKNVYQRIRDAQDKKGILTWLLHHYLFFKIPLVKPDRFLTKTLHYVRFLIHPSLIKCMIGLAFVALYLIAQQWDLFLKTFVYFFNWDGLLYYFLTLGFTKVCHELGHAYVCKYYGLRVPTAGVAFLVMWPVLYTDTTDSWRLTDNKQRLAIGAAGMITELCLAVIATFFWSFLPDGPAKSAAFLIATVTWVLTLAVNLSPFMRFDGYYLLSDYWDIPNLQPRSFAMGRWYLRKILFGFDDSPPEHFRTKTRRFLIIYAYATWIYRFFLFLGIALLVYYFFFKALGIFLMIVEVAWFIALPIWRELKVWWTRRKQMTWNLKTRRWVIVLTAGLLLLIFPWRSHVEIPSILHYSNYLVLYPPVPSQVVDKKVSNVSHVSKEQILYQLASPHLEHSIQKTELKIKSLQWELSRQPTSEAFLQNSLVTQSQLASEMAQLLGYKKEKEQLVVRAPFDGVILDIPSEIRNQVWISDKSRLGVLIEPQSLQVDGYVSEDDLYRIQIGQKGRFYPDQPPFKPVPVQIKFIDMGQSDQLQYPYLASIYGGPIPVQGDPMQGYVPQKAIFKVVLTSLDPNVHIQTVERGTVIVDGERQSLLAKIFRSIASVLIRESGF